MIRLKSEEKAEEKRKRLKRYGKAEVRGKVRRVKEKHRQDEKATEAEKGKIERQRQRRKEKAD
jgi:hypothetical protein